MTRFLKWLGLWGRKPRSQKMNTIKMLRPWKVGSIWVFDDDSCGLRGEPFVANASELIDRLVKFYQVRPDKEGKILLLFSHVPFPDSVKLYLIEDSSGCGVTYRWKEMRLDAWLCPAFYNYFDSDQVPLELYAQAA